MYGVVASLERRYISCKMDNSSEISLSGFAKTKELTTTHPRFLHSDNGAPIRSFTLASKMAKLRVSLSFFPATVEQRLRVCQIVVSHNEIQSELSIKSVSRLAFSAVRWSALQPSTTLCIVTVTSNM